MTKIRFYSVTSGVDEPVLIHFRCIDVAPDSALTFVQYHPHLYEAFESVSIRSHDDAAFMSQLWDGVPLSEAQQRALVSGDLESIRWPSLGFVCKKMPRVSVFVDPKKDKKGRVSSGVVGGVQCSKAPKDLIDSGDIVDPISSGEAISRMVGVGFTNKSARSMLYKGAARKSGRGHRSPTGKWAFSDAWVSSIVSRKKRRDGLSL